VSPVKYEMGLYIPEDDILHNHCRENLKSYAVLLCGACSTVVGSGTLLRSQNSLV
jgi:hypothetical protein